MKIVGIKSAFSIAVLLNFIFNPDLITATAVTHPVTALRNLEVSSALASCEMQGTICTMQC